MKKQRTPQEQYDRLNKMYKKISIASLFIMPLFCAGMMVFAFMENHPLWASLVVLAISVCGFVLSIVSSICSVKLRKLKKLIESIPCEDPEENNGNNE